MVRLLAVVVAVMVVVAAAVEGSVEWLAAMARLLAR
jgi:hypothetical protein